MRALWIAVVFCAGCISANFHSKTGQTYPVVTHQAVIVEGDEARALFAAGAEVIGTISSEGAAMNRTDDLTDKAARVAAENGGTHVLLSSTDEIVYTQQHPATVTKQCTDGDAGYECEKTYQPGYETQSSRPTADYKVIRVPPERWAALPPNLRPSR